MKNILIAAMLMGSTAFAGLTETQIVLTKDDTVEEFAYLASTVKRWCNDINTVAHFYSYEAAVKAESLANGFYVCSGKFIVNKYMTPIQVFALDNCALTNPEAFKSVCPTPAE